MGDLLSLKQMLAIVSDIHSNLEALQEVLQHIYQQGLTDKDIICLGDVVGYGPNPREVLDVCRNFRAVVRGNHDEAVVGEALGFNPLAREAVFWTRSQLKPGLFSSGKARERWEFLKNMPLTHQEAGVLYVHGSPREPTMEYVLRSDTDDLLGEVPAKIRLIFERFEWLCFAGHTHDPGVITIDGGCRFVIPKDVNCEYTVRRGQKLFVNVGSVGQPRDGDNRSCYATFDEETIRWHRVPYDFRKTAEKIQAISQLDVRIGDRLALGR